MKFHILALGLTGVFACGTAAHSEDRYSGSQQGKSSHEFTTSSSTMTSGYGTTKSGKYFTYYGEPLYYRNVLFPDLPTVREVADKMSRIVGNQRHEAAELTGYAGKARTVGYSNITTVYEHMAADHTRIADHGIRWLTSYGFPTPAHDTTMAVADLAPEASIDRQIEMHTRHYNEALAQLKGERSSTVRGTLIWSAATAARHIGLLRTLDRDVEFGRRDVSAMLRSQLEGTTFASSETERISQIITEENAYLSTQTTTTTAASPQIIEHVVEVDRPVYVDRVVERVVEKPVIVERIVERTVTVTVPAVRSSVAGERNIRRMRRPAK